MQVKNFKGQTKNEWDLSIDDLVIAGWACNYRFYKAKAKVIKINAKSIKVELLEPADTDYPVHWKISIPSFNNLRRSSLDFVKYLSQ